ncbi:hypothetical protein OH733_05475 [Streptomyces griseus]|uniref:DUF7298 domain-containing protein n=1 Tax=Streptomyces griseus TaxID=1911 RepID=UPI00386CC152|nr:hypothetical protein OH733_05475 [Streptomyces griseus]WTD71160.1 hypothetical protein OH763_31510 [Streptomyces griseus]
MGLLSPGYAPRGVVALLMDLPDSPAVENTETMVYELPFRSAPKRIYRVNIRLGRADTNSTGDAAAHSAKNSLVMRCRWAAGSTVTTSSTSLGDYRVTVFDDDSNTSTGVSTDFYLINPPAGQLTVGISIRAARVAATYGNVRVIADGHAHLAVEDVGPFSE